MSAYISKVFYERKYNLGDYQSETLSCEVVNSDSENAESGIQLMAEARKTVVESSRQFLEYQKKVADAEAKRLADAEAAKKSAAEDLVKTEISKRHVPPTNIG